MQKIGLTGGIGSGKSTVAGLLVQAGAYPIDADALARACTAPGGAAMDAIAAQFGPTFIDATGALDRQRMRAAAFSDPQVKQRLEAIIHPLVGQAIAAHTRQAQTQGARCAVYDIPLLVESGHWRKSLDRVLVIDCSPETQVLRVSQRNGLSAAQIEPIMAAQASRLQRLRAADWVLHNEGLSMDELAALVRQLARQFGL